MTKIITIANHKGGVAKTTTVVNVGSILAARGHKVLLIDLDAQANLTSSLLSEIPENTINDALKGKEALPIVQVRENLSIVPSSLDLATIELELSGRISREFVLANKIEPIKENYDYILLDCAPSLGLTTINALTAADYLIIPLTAEALPAKGLKMLFDIAEMVQNLNKGLQLGGIVITRWERSKLSQGVEDTLRANFEGKVFDTKIRKNIALAEAPMYTQDVYTYAPESNGAKDYEQLTIEIEEKL